MAKRERVKGAFFANSNTLLRLRVSFVDLARTSSTSTHHISRRPRTTPINFPQSTRRITVTPQSYKRIGRGGDRPRGGGTDNDGVFANVTAKPAAPVSLVTDNGDVHVVPEETQQEAPPVRDHFFTLSAPQPPIDTLSF